MNKKGFSLVELAMVLVIIGVLIAMGIKAYSMVTAARARQLLISVDKIGTGLNTYYLKYGILPGDDISMPLNSITTNSPGAVEKLINSGLVDETDFQIKDFKQAVLGSWRFVSCQPTMPRNSIYSIWATADRGMLSSVCLTGDSNTDIYGTTFSIVPVASVPEQIMAAYELYADDVNIMTGLGRGGYFMTTYDRKTFMSMLNSSKFVDNAFTGSCSLGGGGATCAQYAIKIW